PVGQHRDAVAGARLVTQFAPGIADRVGFAFLRVTCRAGGGLFIGVRLSASVLNFVDQRVGMVQPAPLENCSYFGDSRFGLSLEDLSNDVALTYGFGIRSSLSQV